ARCSDVVDLKRSLWEDLALCAQVVVVHVRVAHTLREDNACQERRLRVGCSPPGQIPYSLGANALARVRRCPQVRRGGSTRVANGTGRVAGGGAIDDHRITAVQGCAISFIEGIIRRVPSRVGKRIVESRFIGNAKSAAQRSLAISEHVPSKTNARTKVIVIALA